MKLKLCATSLALALILGVGWVAQSQPADTTKRLPEGSWTLAARESGQALLVPKPRRHQNLKGSEKAAETSGQALLISPGASPSLIATRPRGLFASGRNSQPRVWSTQFAGRKVLFNPAGSGPALSSVSGRPGDYVFSADGTVWDFRSGAAPKKLASDSVPGFSREDLTAAGGFESGGGLIWAAAPLASPDGRFVVYVSNRESAKAASQGQSVWMIDAERGGEQALLSTPGESFTPLAWMGEELLFTGNKGGISAVDPVSGAVRELGPGTLLAVEPAAGVIASLEGNLPKKQRLVITRADGKSRIARLAGFEYAGSADFSPDGSRLAVVISAADGRKQIQIVNVATGKSGLLVLPPRHTSLVDPPRWVDDKTLLLTTSLRRSGEERSSLLPIPDSIAR